MFCTKSACCVDGDYHCVETYARGARRKGGLCRPPYGIVRLADYGIRDSMTPASARPSTLLCRSAGHMFMTM